MKFGTNFTPLDESSTPRSFALEITVQHTRQISESSTVATVDGNQKSREIHQLRLVVFSIISRVFWNTSQVVNIP